MSAIRQLVVVTPRPSQLLSRVSPLINYLNTRFSQQSNLVLVFRPSLKSQLTDESLALWSRVTTSLYTGVSKSLTISLGSETKDNTDTETLELESLPTEDTLTVTRSKTDKIYSEVVLGGTFDKIHTGHKILVTEAILRCSNRLTVGVTGPQLLQKKTLPELISNVEERIINVHDVIKQIDDKIETNVVKIDDPFGPAIVVPELECIVASEETEKGCKAINDRRVAGGLSELDIHLIDLVEDKNREQDCEEDKISSSSARIRLLGSRLKDPTNLWDRQAGPYLIGLTGGSASGKTSVGERLAGLGFGVINCDKLGHQAYSQGTQAYREIVAEFGPTVVDSEGNIVRKELGAIVFADKSKLEKLNQIVWPEISRLAMEMAEKMWKDGTKVVVLDAAVLLEAGWEKMCHEVWVCVVPRTEAISRIVARDGVTEESAGRRLDNQLSNQERVDRATSVFCTLWDPEITRAQVEKAVKRLLLELEL